MLYFFFYSSSRKNRSDSAISPPTYPFRCRPVGKALVRRRRRLLLPLSRGARSIQPRGKKGRNTLGRKDGRKDDDDPVFWSPSSFGDSVYRHADLLQETGDHHRDRPRGWSDGRRMCNVLIASCSLASVCLSVHTPSLILCARNA